MEWVSIKPAYNRDQTAPDPEVTIFARLAQAGFHLEMMRRNVAPVSIEYFYFHPVLHIQVHEVQEPEGGTSRFFIFYADGRTDFLKDTAQLYEKLSALTH
ncbi:hypothetical protein MKQ70_02290 [Chitinophaga sedimenti]|uniref:hypothetical protein n=1 Tax=Chitinophaga sedimenti TaxID=2033606 RepID=UPI0020039614|nr:hypothetical protein [Chitinophaga sedimenti]MCK7553898.1 hypothetical protein [Chitinophaga sedimenti]